MAGKLLTDLGAEVVMLEPAAGSPLRAHGLFDHLAGGKRSVVPSGDDDVTRLARRRRRRAHRRLVAVARPRPVRPGRTPTVLVDLSVFGRSGPYAGWASSDLVTWAMGGYLYFTGAPDREPIWVPGPQAQFHAGSHAAFAALVGLHERERSGRGQVVEIADLDATLTAHAWLVSSWAACGQLLARQPMDLIRCADGWVYVMRIVPKDELFVMIERPDLGDENLTVDIPTWNAHIPRIFEAVQEWALDKTVAEVVELGQLLRVAVTPIMDGAGSSSTSSSRPADWWEREGDIAFPGQPYRFTATPAARRGPAPAIGEHTGAPPPASFTPPTDPAAPRTSRSPGSASSR